MVQFYDAFISYGRADSKDFATRLYERLTALGYGVWFDQNDIPLGVDYQQEIDGGLERSHNFIFIMAPHSVNSPYCGLEVERAVLRHKRIIPLLHVDELPRATWQQRNPQGTDEEWAEYQAQKLHFGDVRNPRIHPLLGKINWVYGREGIDDFEAAFAGIVSIIERHKDYVQQHTELLSRALEWEQNQRRSQYLLVGQDRKQAEAWLQIRFETEQAPCLPTELHGEYITESIKNGNNLMTQVFLSYANEDLVTMQKIRRSLWLEGITVWTNTTDIQTGEAFQQAIDRGIEQADNFIYLLSPHSIHSTYCQYELTRAIALHKRIIPILMEVTPLEEQPKELQELHYIDLTDNEREEDYHLDESQLLKILRTDESYFQTHKILLAKAIKWEQQHRNPSILLRGYNLQEAETWLKTAKLRTSNTPTNLQLEFLEESLQQPPADSLDVFVSYSRADADFARKLNDSLQIFGKLTWFDQESIATSSADFQQEINRGIEVSDNFLFILSPESVNSPYCADEVEYAASLNKRVITILYRPIKTQDLHPELAKVQWLDFNRYDGDFGQNFNELVRALDTDREHVRSHTKWSQRAIEWEQKERTEDLLLRGNEFAIAQNWLQEAQAEQKKPVPTELQTLFLTKSKEGIDAEIRKEKRQKVVLRSLLGVMTGVSIMAVGASILAFIGQQKATRNEIHALAAVADADLAVNKEFDSLLEGLKAAQLLEKNPLLSDKQRKELKNQIANTLQQTLYKVTEKNQFQHEGSVTSLAISPDGQRIATADYDGIKIWTISGQKLELKDKDFEIWNTKLLFGQDSKTLITAGYDTSIKLWNIETGELIQKFNNGKKFKEVSFPSVNQKHSTITTFDGKLTQLWDEKGELLMEIESHDEYGLYFHFSDDGQILISQETAKDSGQQQLKSRKRDGKLLNQFDLKEGFYISDISSDGQMIFLSDEKTLEARNQKGELVREIYKLDNDKQEKYKISSLSISPNDEFSIVTVEESDTKSTIQILDKTGKKIHQEEIDFSDEEFSGFSQDSRYFISKNNKDNSITLWNTSGQKLKTMKGHSDSIYAIQFIPNSQHIASISRDASLRLWSLESELVQSINNQIFQWSEDRQFFISYVKGGSLRLHPMAISADLKKIITILPQTEGNVSWDMTDDAQTIVITGNDAQGSWDIEDLSWYSVQVWHRNSNQSKTIIPKSPNKAGYVESQLSPDGQMILTTIWQDSETASVQLWSVEGKLIQTLLPEGSYLTYQFDNSAIQWVNDGQNIVTIEKNKVKLWNNKGKLVKTLIDESATSDQYSLSFNVWSQGDRLVTYLRKKGNYNNAVQLWDMQGRTLKTLVDQYNITEDDTDSFIDISFNKKSYLILISDYRKTKDGLGVKIQASTKDGELVQWEENGKKKTSVIDVKNIDQNDWPYADFAGENGEKVFTAETGELLKIWDFKDNLLSLSKELPTNVQKRLNFTSLSPDGQTLAIKSLGSKTIYLWDLSTHKLGEKRFNGSARNSDWSSDGRNFATGSNDGTVQIWNRESNSITELNNLGSAVQGIRFSADNSVLATADADQIVLYDLKKVNSWEKVLKESCDWMADYLESSKEPEDADAKKLCDRHRSKSTD